MATNTRTYGKRSRRQSTHTARETEQPSSSSTSTARKRQRVSSETATRTPSPALTEEAEPLASTLRSASIADNADEESQASQSHASPVRPKKPARDLSGIFGALNSAQSPSPSPTKLARRMLGRSKTETSITSEPTAEGSVDRTFSLPSIPSSPSRPVLLPSKSSSALLPVLPPAADSPKTRTYAGKYRSFLVNVSSSSSAQQSQILDDENEFDTRESYNSLRERWGVDNSEDDPYPHISPASSFSATPDASPSRKGKGKASGLPTRPPAVAYPGGLSNPLKSISELRNKGESRRFLDELGYLFEGLDRNGGIGLKRASALEICTKLCDTDFARKAKAADLYTRTWDLLVEAGGGQGEDKILDTLMVFFAALVSRDPGSLTELASRAPSDSSTSTSFVEILFTILSSMTPDVDPLVVVASRPGVGDADLKKVGLTKRDRAILTSVYQTITKSSLFEHDTPISISLLISHTLSALPASLVTATPAHFSTFLKSLRLSLAPHASSTSASSGSSFSSLSASLALRWTDAAQSVPMQSVYQHLRLLDTYLLDQWGVPTGDGEGQSSQDTDVTDGSGGATEGWREANEAEMKTARDTWLAQDLVAFGLCTELVAVEEDDDLDTVILSRKCLDMVLRVLVSLTHGNARWGRKVTEGEYTMGLLLRTIYASARGLQTSRSQENGHDPGGSSPGKVKAESDDGDSEQVIPTSDDSPESPTKSAPGGSQYMDTLCLALGLLTNLVQIADSAKKVVRETALDPACKLKKRACARKCVCPHRSSALKILADIYTQFHTKVEASTLNSSDPLSTDSPEAHAEADASFLRGHLAVLFGLLMIDSPKNQAEIMLALPAPGGKAKDRVKLSRLVDQAKDFAAFYSAVSGTIGGEKESKITTEVVQFLEAQRDAA